MRFSTKIYISKIVSIRSKLYYNSDMLKISPSPYRRQTISFQKTHLKFVSSTKETGDKHP